MQPRRILFIAPTRIGDAVLAASMLRYLTDNAPDAEVTIITSPLAADLYEGLPQLKRIVRITKRTYNRHWLDVWHQTIGTRWDEIWDMRGSIVTFLLRAKKRRLYTKQAPAPKVKQYEQAFGIAHLPYPTLWPRPQDTAAAETLMPSGERYLILAPIANWGPKEWPLANFIALAQAMLEGRAKDFRPVVICAGHEREKALPLLDALATYRPIDLTTGDAPLLTVFACMQRAHGFVGNDSGLMHMAAAASIPTLGLFGPTPHDIYQPWGAKAGYITAPNGDLAQLSVAAVTAALEQRLF